MNEIIITIIIMIHNAIMNKLWKYYFVIKPGERLKS